MIRKSLALTLPFLLNACIIVDTPNDDDDGEGSDESEEGDSSSSSSSSSTSGSTESDGESGESGSGTGTDSDTGANACGVEVDETEPNDDRDNANALTLGEDQIGCLSDRDDADFWEFTAPEDMPADGFVVVDLTDIGEGGAISAEVFSATDNGSIVTGYRGDAGASLMLYFAAVSGQTYRIAVSPFVSTSAFAYTLHATWTAVVDEFEPNQTRAAAVPIDATMPITAAMFAGYASGALEDEAYEDWYEVELAAGDVTVTMSDVPDDITGDLRLVADDGSMVSSAYSATGGANVEMTAEGIEAGTYQIRAGNFLRPMAEGSTGAVPAHFTDVYTLTVEQ